MNPLRADLISPLEMFKIGIGPSSSHTMGPMLASNQFRDKVLQLLMTKSQPLANLQLVVELYGSLSLTGLGHGTDGAICAGLMGLKAKTSDVEKILSAKAYLEQLTQLNFDNNSINFIPSKNIKFLAWKINDQDLPHPNTLRFLLSSNEQIIFEEIYISIGGGFIELIDQKTLTRELPKDNFQTNISLPFPYNSAQEFVEQCMNSKLKPWNIVIANMEICGISETVLRAGLKDVLRVFNECIENGLKNEGILPGGLNVKRRAKALYAKMNENSSNKSLENELKPSVYAIAVNEENAAGGRVVTAPTNGSSGLIPAVFRYLQEQNNLSLDMLQNGLIVASVIGALVKTHASISGAEVGCQGEVGTSCAMAAGGACAMLGGNPHQIEQAAEIGIEHHLGLTCDPVMGLVQVPCIERNAMGAVKALNAVALALACDGQHMVSLDKALKVMKETGLDMNQKYKETSTGGLALG